MPINLSRFPKLRKPKTDAPDDSRPDSWFAVPSLQTFPTDPLTDISEMPASTKSNSSKSASYADVASEEVKTTAGRRKTGGGAAKKRELILPTISSTAVTRQTRQ